MATGELITHLDLTLLGNVNLSHLQDTRRQLITNGNGELAAVLLSGQLLVLADEVHDQMLNHVIDALIIRPAITLNTIILEVLQSGYREAATLVDDLSICVILHTL